MLRLFLNFLEKNHDGTGGFPESANLQTTFGGFPAFLVIAQEVSKPWFRKKSKNDFFRYSANPESAPGQTPEGWFQL